MGGVPFGVTQRPPWPESNAPLESLEAACWASWAADPPPNHHHHHRALVNGHWWGVGSGLALCAHTHKDARQRAQI